MPIPLFAWLAGAGLLAAAGGAWTWLFGSATAVPDACRGRVRIWVAGPTGAGKTSLVAAILEEPVPPRSPPTTELAWRWREDRPLALADTVGLELAGGADQVEAAARLLRRMPPSALPHVAWICVRAGADRVFGGAGGSEAALAAALTRARVPCIGVLTQAEPAGEDATTTDEMAAAMARTIPDLATVVPVCVRPLLAENGALLVPRHGLDRLRLATVSATSPVVAQRLEREWPPYGW